MQHAGRKGKARVYIRKYKRERVHDNDDYDDYDYEYDDVCTGEKRRRGKKRKEEKGGKNPVAGRHGETRAR